MTDAMWAHGWYDGEALHMFNKDADMTEAERMAREFYGRGLISETIVNDLAALLQSYGRLVQEAAASFVAAQSGYGPYPDPEYLANDIREMPLP